MISAEYEVVSMAWWTYGGMDGRIIRKHNVPSVKDRKGHKIFLHCNCLKAVVRWPCPWVCLSVKIMPTSTPLKGYKNNGVPPKEMVKHGYILEQYVIEIITCITRKWNDRRKMKNDKHFENKHSTNYCTENNFNIKQDSRWGELSISTIHCIPVYFVLLVWWNFHGYPGKFIKVLVNHSHGWAFLG